ncbi:MAG TPA: AAA family ATPase [Archangium sp.]|nr:AAA family ATPase [Archangium sp.]
MEGLVLIDEIDLHLHPKWQLGLIPTLKRVFPKLQFIVTTHSPMLLPGLSREEVVILGTDTEGNVIAHESPESPSLLTGSEIYRTFFGIDRLHPSACWTGPICSTCMGTMSNRTSCPWWKTSARLRAEATVPTCSASGHALWCGC